MLVLSRQEFILGNTSAFFDTPRVAAVHPPLARPDKGYKTYAPATTTPTSSTGTQVTDHTH